MRIIGEKDDDNDDDDNDNDNDNDDGPSLNSLSENGEPLALVPPNVRPKPLRVRPPRQRVLLREEAAGEVCSFEPLGGVVKPH